MELNALPTDIKRYIVTEFLEYEITNDNLSHLLKSLFGRFEGESSCCLVFRHIFTRIPNSKIFHFKKGDLYPKDAYSIEFRLTQTFEDRNRDAGYPTFKNISFLHFISQFPHLISFRGFQFLAPKKLTSLLKELTMAHVLKKSGTVSLKQDLPKPLENRVYKLKRLNLINNACDFTLSKNFPEIQEFSNQPGEVTYDKFFSGIELCKNLVHFRVHRLKKQLWTAKIVESLFGLPNVKSLKLGDCNLKDMKLNLFLLETSVVEDVVVEKNSVESLTALLSNTNIRRLTIGGSMSLTGTVLAKNTLKQTLKKFENTNIMTPMTLFDLVLTKERFENDQFQYVACVSLCFTGYYKLSMNDSMAFLTQGKFDRLILSENVKMPQQVLECVPKLKVLEYNSALVHPKRIESIMAEEIILNNEGATLKDFVPPSTCKKLQLNDVAMRGDNIKRLMGLGIEITFDGLDAAKIFAKIENYDGHYFAISKDEPDRYIEDEDEREEYDSEPNIEGQSEDGDERDDDDDDDMDDYDYGEDSSEGDSERQ